MKTYSELLANVRSAVDTMNDAISGKYVIIYGASLDTHPSNVDPYFRNLLDGAKFIFWQCMDLRKTEFGHIVEDAPILSDLEDVPAFLYLQKIESRLIQEGFNRNFTIPERPIQPNGKPVDRDMQFLEWYEAEGTTTYHSPAKIRDKWNNSRPKAEQISDQTTQAAGIDIVKKGIRRARKRRDVAMEK
ncbi:hypothetical protein [Symmachiella dynata]|uniref:hypothetical protein n=1 Tax=Symmachiella dynata TaxID=2527995 RepID=UPI0030EF1DF9